MALSDLIDRVKELQAKKVKVGWFDSSKYPDGTPVAYVASIQEFGAHGQGVNIPPRPFMRPAVANYKAEWGQSGKDAAEQVIAGRFDAQQALTYVGGIMEGDVVRQITEPKTPLSRLTLLLRKWRDDGRVINKSVVEEARRELAKDPSIQVSANQTPLDDTNYMIATLTNEVVDA